MKKSHLTTQHRPGKESKEISKKEVSELRSQNKRLQRQISRLNKQIEKLSFAIPEESFDEQEIETKEKEQPTEPTCPVCCSKTLREIKLGNKTTLICKDCLWRTTSSDPTGSAL